MLFSKDRNSDTTSENVEQEDTVKVEETSVNLDCVKRELDEEELEFEQKRYKLALTFENVFGESSTQQRNNRDGLIGFLDGDVIMETGSIKLEDVKEENKDLIRKNMEQSYCNKCGGNYQGYCLNCSSLSHILNNLTPNLNPEPVLNTTPLNVLEIREVSRGCAVFALKTLPKGIILGPFEGIAPIKSTTGLQWKMKDKKFINDQNGNWMKYIQSVAKLSSKNLDVFEFDGILYFETSREIQEGEELLVCYPEEKEEVLKSDKEEVLVPVKKEEYPKVFACTLCCLGFRLEGCLVEHKNKCPQGDHGGSIEDFEIIQCRCCKVWLEKLEHLERHMLHCLNNYNRSCRSRNLPDFASTIRIVEEQVLEIEEKTTSLDVNASYSTPPTEPIDSNNCISRADFKVHKEGYIHDVNMGTAQSTTKEKEYKCSACSYQTNRKGSLKIHLGTHTDIKDFQCDVCEQRFGRKGNLKVHIKNKHSNTNEKDFECDICKQRFGQKSSLKVHIRNKHTNTNEKEYQCSECSYQTNRKCDLKIHLLSHTGVKNFQCDICKQRFSRKGDLNVHMKNKHSNTNEKEYKCSACSYQTNHKGNLKIHLGTHVKNFQSNICKQRFGHTGHLIMHIKNKHSNTNEKEYKCSECLYQTNDKSNLKNHLVSHTGVKNFQCDICKQRFGRKFNLKVHIKNKHSNTNKKDFECDICKQRFGQKNQLIMHIKNKHSNTNEKEYKCSSCSYQTNRKGNLKVHLGTHVKNFQCDICKQRFGQKNHLIMHIKNKHSNTNEKEYKCSECSYQTNRKGDLKIHLGIHTGIKDFECDICKQRFGQKSSLKVHIRNKHSNTNEKEDKCSEC